MHFTSASLLTLLVGLASLACVSADKHGHHSHVKRQTSCKGSTPKGQSSADRSVNAPAYALRKNCVNWGWIPDDGDRSHGSQGTKTSILQLDAAVGCPYSPYRGAYAHIDGNAYRKGQSSTYFIGSEITGLISELKASKATFVPSIMPTYGWGGMTTSDNAQAIAIAKVCKKFTDEGIPVYLRFAHEMNYYQLPYTSDDGQSQYYAGNYKDFLQGWEVVTKAVREYAPGVKMFWSPNIASTSNYAQYWPGSSYVDIVGVDVYGKDTNFANTVVGTIKPFHDAYAAKYKKPMFMGETGYQINVADSVKLGFAEKITSTSTCQTLPYLVGLFWFNYQKGGVDFRMVDIGGSSLSTQFGNYMRS